MDAVAAGLFQKSTVQNFIRKSDVWVAARVGKETIKKMKMKMKAFLIAVAVAVSSIKKQAAEELKHALAVMAERKKMKKTKMRMKAFLISVVEIVSSIKEPDVPELKRAGVAAMKMMKEAMTATAAAEAVKKLDAEAAKLSLLAMAVNFIRKSDVKADKPDVAADNLTK